MILPVPADPRGPTSLYLPLAGGAWQPTALTLGPWSDDAQHGGPIGALMARAVELCEPERGLQIARLTIELLRPVPLSPITVRAASAGGGRSVDRVGVEVCDERGTVVASALAVRIRRKDVSVPVHSIESAPTAPDDLPALLPHTPRVSFVTHAMDIRAVRGGFVEPGPCLAWFGLRVPVVPGEVPSGVQRAVAAADSANGISSVASFATHLFVNPDLTVALHRIPAGEWVALDASSRLDSAGIGGAHAALSDLHGSVGFAYQTLLVSGR